MKQPPPNNLEVILEALGNKFRKLTLHSENPKHPSLIWQATPNQHSSKFKRSVRGKTPKEAAYNLLLEINKLYENKRIKM
jgi:CRISPR/Cas system type I-B associated protein Csh2 (Cas7 group RAMP superfamily)